LKARDKLGFGSFCRPFVVKSTNNHFRQLKFDVTWNSTIFGHRIERLNIPQWAITE